MSYKVFARAYRPSTFSEIKGQDVAVRILKNAIKTDRLGHAILLTGIRGVGKTTSARLIAKTISCLSLTKDTEPCGQCASCKAMQSESHLDIIEMDAASHTGVDDVREIIETVAYAPTIGKYKVYVIDEVHMLSKNAFNALLKTLEEPPAHVVFIFATTELQKVPETIVSRCVHIPLRKASESEIFDNLVEICTKESITFEEPALKTLALNAGGSFRDSLSLLEKAVAFSRGSDGEVLSEAFVYKILGRFHTQSIVDIFSCVIEGKTKEALGVLSEAKEHNLSPKQFVSDLLELIHEFTCCISIQSEPTEKEKKAVWQDLKPALTIPQLNRYWSVVSKSLEEVLSSPLPYACLDIMIIRLCHLESIPSVSELVSDLKKKQPSQVLTQKKEIIFDQKNVKNDVKIDSFESLLTYVENCKEPLLSFSLKRDVIVHRFESGLIKCSLKSHSDPDLIRQLRMFLLQYLPGQTWQVVMQESLEIGTQTHFEKQEEIVKNKKDGAKNHPLVHRALDTFPESAIDQVELDAL